MNEKERKVADAILDVLHAESSLREAEVNLETGRKKADADQRREQANVDRILAELYKVTVENEREINRLKEVVERETVNLDREKNYVKFTKAELERGFDA